VNSPDVKSAFISDQLQHRGSAKEDDNPIVRVKLFQEAILNNKSDATLSHVPFSFAVAIVGPLRVVRPPHLGARRNTEPRLKANSGVGLLDSQEVRFV
ncbi:MAG: hypothetical protein ACKPKO_28845, partial [Candidatus Fonsibacter sp.]